MSELASYFSLIKCAEVHLVLLAKRERFYVLPSQVIIHEPHFNYIKNSRLVAYFRTFLYLRGKLKIIKPDSVLSFGEMYNSFVLISSFFLSIKVFVSDRSSPTANFGIWHSLLKKILYRKAEGIIAQTEKAKEIILEKVWNTNVSVIGNPIKIDNEVSGDPDRENSVLMVGRIIRTKHQDKLIELFSRIDIPGWKLIIVGDDHSQKSNNLKQLATLIKDLKAEDKIILKGLQADVDRFYSSSSIFAFTSSSEGFPNVILEAMSAGLPVIAFDCTAGPSELIKNNENGYLIPLFDFEQFKEKLEILMGDQNLRLSFGLKSKELAQNFSIETIGNEYYRFLTGVK
jgi:GalNAc-alpha-(1->4)-GalNAc-alpha-(1->3)-diNAcBac-PP-undecaprenol alpha-1,4-N-acetyl-D-galactosaminyltransferase